MNEKQDTPPTILLIEKDDETRPLLTYNLRSQGYRVIVTLEEEDAFERINGGRKHPDVILLNQGSDRSKGKHARKQRQYAESKPRLAAAQRFASQRAARLRCSHTGHKSRANL